MKIINAEVYGSDRKFHIEDIYISKGLFSGEETDKEVVDASGCYAIPGLIDIHLHGACGFDVCDGSLEAFERIAEYELRCGVTSICPATLTLPVDDLCRVMAVGAEFSKNRHDNMADLVGFNMEGPFISRAKKGAQNGDHIIRCDREIAFRFIESSEGLVKIIGIAPEENPDFEEYIREVRDKVVVSLSHTDTDYDTAMRAFAAGAGHVVHLYNAMRGLGHRDPGLVGAFFDSKASCEIICDGIHVHPAAVRAAYACAGADRMVLISDSLRCTGMEDGIYDLGGIPVSKKGNVCRILNERSIAGSVTNLFECMKIAVTVMGIELEKAVASATIIPAKVIGVDDMYGSIEVGKKADLLLVDKDGLNLVKVVKNGKLVKTIK